MPKAKSFIPVAEYAVLGLLRERPAHGYDLQRYLSGRHGLGIVCPIEPAMVYAILKSLSGLELINGEWDNTTYPPKAIYSVTEAGDAEFQRWLMRPVGRMREIRQDLMVKLYFLINSETDSGLSDVRRLIDQQGDVCEAYAKEIEAELEGVPPGSFDALALGSKLSAARMTRTWLLDSVKVLEEGRREYASRGLPCS